LVQAGLVGIVVALVFALVIARSVVRPLRNVADTARAIALGQRDRKAKVQGPREVRTLAEAFNGMMDQVEASTKAQREFLANVSHDLRTPLTSIQGYSQALIDGVANTPEGTKRAAQVINEEAARMYRMVEELLDLARIEAGKLSMTRYKVQIGDLAQAVSDRMAIMARSKGIALVTNIAPNLPIVAGDGDRLSQVFTNLIENALKHTAPGGTVTVAVANAAEKAIDGVLITVHDTGEGIPAADLPRIFDRFYQVDKSRQRHEGVGLGLQICFQIVQAHGGRIWVESEEGQWTRFSVWLPGFNFDSTTIIKRRTGTFAAAPTQPKP
jgi:signal transduction histidine kinase